MKRAARQAQSAYGLNKRKCAVEMASGNAMTLRRGLDEYARHRKDNRKSSSLNERDDMLIKT